MEIDKKGGKQMNLIKIIKQYLCGHNWVARIVESKQKWQPDTHWRVIAAEYRCPKCGKTRPMDVEKEASK
jgi:rubredoxin